MSKGNLKGTAKVDLSGVNNIITKMNNTNNIPPEHNGKIMRLHLSCLDPDIDFWTQNFAIIPIDLNEYKKHREDYVTWIKARVSDLGNELIYQMDLKSGVKHA